VFGGSGFWFRTRMSRRVDWGSGLRVSGTREHEGLVLWGFGFRVWGLGCGVPGTGFRVRGFGFRVSGSGFRLQRLGVDTRVS